MQTDNTCSSTSWFATRAITAAGTAQYVTVQKLTSQTANAPGWFSVFWSILQWVLFVVGSAGNLLVVTVLLWSRSRSQVVTQLFVGSLSMAGLALTLSSTWIQGLSFTGNGFPFDRTACKIQYYSQAVSLYSQAWNLVAVAADRFLGIDKPGKESFVKMKWAIVMVTAIWVTSAATNIPLLFWSDVTIVGSTGMRYCLVTGVDPIARAVQVTFARIAYYFVPLVITWLCYVGLIIKMKTALKVLPGSTVPKSASNTTTGPSGSVASRKVTVMCIAIASCFTLTSLPLQIDLLIAAFAEASLAAHANSLILYLGLGTTFNACTNPFIYGFLWRPFRSSLNKIARDMTRRCRQPSSKSDSSSFDINPCSTT